MDKPVLNIDLRNKFRLPASVEDQPSISKLHEEEFQKLLHSATSNQFYLRLQLRLDAIEEVYFRAKDSLNEFDKKLKESDAIKDNAEQFFSKIINSGVYSNLLALRENNLSRQKQFNFFLKRFLEVANDQASTQAEIDYSKAAFVYIGNYYRSLPAQYLVAHYQIALEAHDLVLENKYWAMGIKRAIGMKRSIDDSAEDLFSKYHQIYENKEVVQEIEIISKKLKETKTSIGDEIKKSGYMIQIGLMNIVNVREPQSLKYSPSTGTGGNITGYSFPKGDWAITFDDGPHPVYTQQIAKNLEEYKLHSTFFALSKNVIQYPKIINEIKSMGMEIANHSHDHPQLPKLSDSQLDFQIAASSEKIASVSGDKPKYFRCPYGAGTNIPRIRAKIAKEEMIHVFWSVDSLDWQDRNPASIVERVKKQVSISKNGGGVILFHDIHPQSVIASKEIMKYLKDGAGDPLVPTNVKTIGQIIEKLNNEK
jgi:peptidoglycan/xylan/chitin deacetylase (PgdA/CDA1 family)